LPPAGSENCRRTRCSTTSFKCVDVILDAGGDESNKQDQLQDVEAAEKA